MNVEALIEVVMTQHWDLAMCRCWFCATGRALGLGPRDEYLRWREAGLCYMRNTRPDDRGPR